MRTDESRPRSFATIFLVLTALLVTGHSLAQATRPAAAQPRDAKAEVTALLHEFLGKVTSPAMHQRFWADDVIYVSNGGVARTKADILKGMKAEETAAPAGGGALSAGWRVLGRGSGRASVRRHRRAQLQARAARGRPARHVVPELRRLRPARREMAGGLMAGHPRGATNRRETTPGLNLARSHGR